MEAEFLFQCSYNLAVRCSKVVHFDLAVPVVCLAYCNYFGVFPE